MAATTHAAYANMLYGQREYNLSLRRASNGSAASSTSASSNKTKLSLKNALKHLTPTSEEIRPTGTYAPIIKQGPLFGRTKKSQKSDSQNSSAAGSRKHSYSQGAVDAALLR